MRVELNDKNTENLRRLSNVVQISVNSLNNLLLDMLFTYLTPEQVQEDIKTIVKIAIVDIKRQPTN